MGDMIGIQYMGNDVGIVWDKTWMIMDSEVLENPRLTRHRVNRWMTWTICTSPLKPPYSFIFHGESWSLRVPLRREFWIQVELAKIPETTTALCQDTWFMSQSMSPTSWPFIIHFTNHSPTISATIPGITKLPGSLLGQGQSGPRLRVAKEASRNFSSRCCPSWLRISPLFIGI